MTQYLINYSFILQQRSTIDELLQSCLQCLIDHHSPGFALFVSLSMTSVESLLMSVCGALRERARTLR